MVVVSCTIDTCEFKTQVVGDQTGSILLSHYIATEHSNANQVSSNIQDRAQRPQRPIITTELTPQQWSNIIRYWKIYKKEARLNTTNIITQLITCCDEELRNQLFNAHSEIEEKEEEEVIKAIRELAVKSESVIVAQVNHVKCRQGRDEPVRKWFSRLKGQASVCDYTITFKTTDGMEHTKSYEDNVLRQIIAANMDDSDIQTDLLSILNSSKKSMTADEMVCFIEAKENAKQGTVKLSSTHSINALHSTYKKNSRPAMNTYSQATRPKSTTQNTNKDKCSHCGTYGHGNHWGFHGANIRKKLGCPAYGKTCNKCHRLGHFGSMCRIPGLPRQTTAVAENEEAYMIGGAIGIQHE